MGDTVYRIQDKDGRGPFKPGFAHKWVQDRPDCENLHSFLVEFGWEVLDMRFTWEGIGSACRTKQQLRRWFIEKEYRKLKKLGYQAVELEASRVLAESDIQLVFTRSIPLNKNVHPFKLY